MWRGCSTPLTQNRPTEVPSIKRRVGMNDNPQFAKQFLEKNKDFIPKA